MPVCVPLLLQSECDTHTLPGHLSSFVYYGGDRDTDPAMLAQYDVVITTYGVLQSEHKVGKEGRTDGQREGGRGGLGCLCVI